MRRPFFWLGRMMRISESASPADSGQIGILEGFTRLDVIDEHGRVYSRRDIALGVSVQDGGRTLKVFVEAAK